MKRLIAAIVVATLATGLLFVSAASAHDGTSSVVFIDTFPDGTIEGQVEHPVILLNDLFGFDLDPDAATEEEAAGTNGVMLPFNTNSLVLSADGQEWPVTFTDTEVVETENRLYIGYNFVVDQTFDPPPRAFEVTYTGVFDQVDAHVGYVVVRTDPVTGTFRSEVPIDGVENPEGTDFQTDLLTSDDTTSIVDLDDPNTIAALWATIDLGMEHIFIGIDHILFVLVLLIPAVMLYGLSERDWEPVPTFKEGLWRVLKIATAFTVAHSITLTLGGLEIIELPSKFVETVIALSIVATAVHNLRPIFANREAMIAFGFGIFHGFGFAGLLSELGVGRGQRLISLLGFNIGVELGQAFIIILLFPALFLLRRSVVYPIFMKVTSIALGIVAVIWMIERIFEVSLGIDSLLEKITRAPRVFLLIAIATAIAAAIRVVEGGRGDGDGDHIAPEQKIPETV